MDSSCGGRPGGSGVTLRAISYGGGVQSTALCILAARGEIDYPLAIFANVGDRAEKAETIEYIGRHVMPWSKGRIEIVQRRWVDRTGKERDLYDDVTRQGNKTIDIPVYMEGGAPGNRKCTARYKIEVVGRELRKRGASKAAPATVAVGISTDEIGRLNSRTSAAWEVPTYPLIDLRLTRADCAQIIADEGLPPAPKSSCWFCPFQRPQQWAERRRDNPELFIRGVQMEDRINENRAALGRDPVYLTSTLRPLRDLTEAQEPLFHDGPEGCDEGYCWT